MRKNLIVVLFIAITVIFVVSCTSEKKTSSSDNGPYIAVIRIQGPLYGTTVDSLSGRVNGADEIMKQLISARKDPSVKAVLLRIDTPGGSVTAAEEITREIYKLKESGKLVTASMGDMAASAGYWLATCSDYIYANPSTLTGSIGVYIPYTNLEELYKKIGISQDRIKSGEFKDILSSDRPMRAEERVMLQNMVDDMYSNFVKQVSKGRNLSEEEVKKLADGRIYTGTQALELKLVDEIGNYYDALDGTAKKVGIAGEIKVKEYKEPFSILSLLKMNMFGELISEMKVLTKPLNEQEYKGFH